MDATPGARGVVIGDRYRVAGALRRTGLIDAIDLEADRTDAACRVVGVPGDAARVDAWEDAWRAAQDEARLPRLREVVLDEDGAHWAIVGPAPGYGAPLPVDAQVQARVIGEALAEAGLDVDDATRAMLVTAADGRLCLDGIVWLGGDRSPRAAGRALAGLLPRAREQAIVDDSASTGAWDPPPRTSPKRRRRRMRLAIPAAIVVLLVVAGLVLLAPARSNGTAVVAPGGASSGDVLLGSAQYPVVDATDGDDIPAGDPTGVSGASPAPEVTVRAPAFVEPAARPPVTITVTVPVAAAPANEARPDPVVPALPPAAAQRVPELPVADAPPTLPVASGG
ncbi:MAG: hypothetical protein ACR2J9_13130 [Gaiellales bacterium]